MALVRTARMESLFLMIARLAFAGALLLALCAGAAAASKGGLAAWSRFGDGRDVLIVTVHGDLSIGLPATYHYDFALAAAMQVPDSAGVGLLRPGYFDGQGRRSPGSALGRKDNYTREAVDMIADTIGALRAEGGYRHVVGVGHSGGAAIVATAMALRPGVIDSAVLVSCPCDIRRWRDHVLNERASRRDPVPLDWTRSLSPSDHVTGLAPDARVVAITSRTDKLTPPALARDYVAALEREGVNARFVETELPGHFLWNLTVSVLAEVEAEVAALRGEAKLAADAADCVAAPGAESCARSVKRAEAVGQ